jgi:uncharacterized iron-regulated membrane protein
MPIVLIIIGLAVALGLGSYFFRPEAVVTPDIITEVPATEENTDGTTTEPEAGDDAETKGNVPPEDGDAPAPTTPVATTPTTPTTPTAAATAYADGAHTVNTSYTAPGNNNHTMAVTLTLKGDVVTASTITFGGAKVEESSKYQSRFMDAYESQVIGKKLDAIKLSRVGGASLTTGGFNDALAKVKSVATN